MRQVASAMTVAGSDSGGGAGVQADLKTFAALGVYGTSVLTAITAQNTRTVTAVHEIPIDIISAQIDAVVSDIGADSVKTGMLSSREIIECVTASLKDAEKKYPDMPGLRRLVVDPVMVAKSGDSLLREEAVGSLRDLLLPMAAVVTPNIPETETLTGLTIVTDEDVRKAAQAIVAMGAASVVVKGGHREGPATDVYFDGRDFREFTAPRFETVNTHGTGCTFASAVAAGLAKGLEAEDAVGQAKEFVTEAIRRSFPIGQGHGPLNHFYKLWQ
ncbi:MAG: bifunctional hydroxymethylpyrimidine kinase/phosphomethylpyrimidine kinase [Chloroflexi bacterium]|nr:bifunctional hydroxymethylpyrimidine kinase/phosphomethylpyrimidine kinase [Chloroflexota bacterium]MDP6498388.1 bifunctional hydroxymethylpyrimidine kinase/phosphomethylpyrimidine kinase [Dehalococcoidia bacterium]MQG10174.1 bifunctional hydroxymethylpyrimidine kinase/phosphomethylpyrimidine kinase [SAR202 cluster bacterium]MQG55028.1 bifunctional hydroxymethylpyrimidine kinase/phosphomethylpyrimidine kinase [SAR202 cluster bacterium]